MKRHRRGAQLVEVMVAVTLLALVLAGLLGVFPLAARGLAHAESQVEAESLSLSLLDEQRLLTWEQLQPGTRQLAEVQGQTATFRPTLTVLQVDDLPLEDIKELRLEVSWSDRGRTRKCSHTLLVVNLPR